MEEQNIFGGKVRWRALQVFLHSQQCREVILPAFAGHACNELAIHIIGEHKEQLVGELPQPAKCLIVFPPGRQKRPDRRDLCNLCRLLAHALLVALSFQPLIEPMAEPLVEQGFANCANYDGYYSGW